LSEPNMFASGLSNPAVSLQTSFYMLMGLRFRAEEQRTHRSELSKIHRFASLYDAFLADNHHVIATPPVRSVPRKVYTSSDEGNFDKGESAPHELSKIKRSDKKKWARLNRELNNYGRK